MKKKLSLTLGLILTTATCFTSFAAPITEKEAKDLAQKYVPADSIYLGTENDDNHYEINFFHEGKRERYELNIQKSTGKITSFDSKLANRLTGNKVVLTETEAKKQVTNELKNAEILSVKLDLEDGKEYDVRFKTDKFYGEYSINPETGSILERDINIGSMPDYSKASNIMNRDKIMELVNKQVPSGTMTDIDLDRENGTWIYEVEVYKDGKEYDLAFHAATGELLWNYTHNDDWNWRSDSTTVQSSNKYISMDEAKQIALRNAPGATVTKCELDHDDGRAVYEIELRKNRWEYDFEIDAVNGNILKSEKDFDD